MSSFAPGPRRLVQRETSPPATPSSAPRGSARPQAAGELRRGLRQQRGAQHRRQARSRDRARRPRLVVPRPVSDVRRTPLAEALAALVSVILIDIALAGDNAIVVGMAAAGLPTQQRRRAILVGILAAAGLRIVFASFTVQVVADHRTAAGGRHPAAVGGVEAVAGDPRRHAPRAGRTRKRAGEAALERPGSRSCDAIDGPTKDLSPGGHADRHCRRLDVARQRAGCGGGGARARGRADLRPGAVGGADGPRRLADRPPAAPLTTGSPTSASIILYVALRMIWDGAHEVFAAIQP